MFAAALACAGPNDAHAASAKRLDEANISSGRFSIGHTNGWWHLMTPADKPFFSLGVCVVSQGASRQSFDPENPSYAAWRYYADATAWGAATGSSTPAGW